MHLPHPFGITVRKVIIYGDNVDALSFQCVQICRKGGHQGLAFTGTHLGNTSLMQDDTADKLHPVMLHIQHAPCSLPHHRIRLGKQLVKRLPILKPLFKLLCLCPELIIGKLHHLRAQRFNFVHKRGNTL